MVPPRHEFAHILGKPEVCVFVKARLRAFFLKERGVAVGEVEHDLAVAYLGQSAGARDVSKECGDFKRNEFHACLRE